MLVIDCRQPQISLMKEKMGGDILRIVALRLPVAVRSILDADHGASAPAVGRRVAPRPVGEALGKLVRRTRNAVEHVAEGVRGKEDVLRAARDELVAPCHAVVHRHEEQDVARVAAAAAAWRDREAFLCEEVSMRCGG